MLTFMPSSAAIALSLSIGFGLTLVACVDSTPGVARERNGQGRSLHVSACSAYGNGCVAGRVRRGPFGPQVQLRSGTWIDCRGDCGRTLLEETIDFWDSQSDKAKLAIP
jgi:hypothetical protein